VLTYDSCAVAFAGTPHALMQANAMVLASLQQTASALNVNPASIAGRDEVTTALMYVCGTHTTVCTGGMCLTVFTGNSNSNSFY
jgi:hypothetical protein